MQYPGGKGSSYQKIINLIPPHAVYIETHLGGGAVMRAKRPAAVNIGLDLNREVLRATAQSIAPGSIVFSSEPAPSLDVARLANIVRSDVARASSEMAGAARAGIVRNGGAIIVRKGGAPAPRSHRQIERYGPPSPQMAVRDPIAGNGEPSGSHYFLQMDALRLLEDYPFSGDEFIYSDPPYLMETRRQQRPLYEFEYADEEHIALLGALRSLPCRVAISGYYSELYMDLLPGWHTYTFTSQTRGGTPAEEWVWMNYPEPTALHEYTFLGDDFRERERIKRKKQRWVNKLRNMDRLERQAILWAISEGVGPC